jgi:hypothetical protein
MFRWIGRELVGAWRSVRYDLARRADPSRQPTEVLYPEYDAYQRPPRRWFAAAGLGALVAGGVAAVYVVVAGGLGALLSPIVAAVPGLGGGAPAVRPAGTAAAAGPPVAGAPPAAQPTRTPARPTASRPAEVQVGATGPAAPVPTSNCPCPVPVPTPQSTTPSPSHSTSPSPSPSVTPSPSPTPTGGTVGQP